MVYTVTISHQGQSSFKCPICEVSFAVYSSWTRHLKTKHTEEGVRCVFCCDVCGREFESKRSAANHHSKTHGATSPGRRSEEADAGSFFCEFCSGHFPSERSVSQHIRNQHPAEASDQRATQAKQKEDRFWSPQDHHCSWRHCIDLARPQTSRLPIM